MSEAVFHRLDHGAVLARLREYAESELGSRSEVREVVLIGSLARGNWSARSDADLVVIVDGAPERGPFRSQRHAPRQKVGVAVDVFVYTPQEARAWSPRFRTEVEHGVVLYRRGEAGPAIGRERRG